MKRTLTAMVAALGAVAAMTQAAPAQAAPAGKHHAAHRVARDGVTLAGVAGFSRMAVTRSVCRRAR